jgi:polysaccharide chain length determinant protein (PEP-CTERM system associated)
LPEPESEGNIGETIERVVGMLDRQQKWIVLTASAVALATIGALQLLPNRYTSTAALVVVQQQIPQRYVVPNSISDPNSALEAMKQEVLSRTRLLDMIRDFGLYPKQRVRLAPEQLVAIMLKDIDIDPFGNTQQKDFDGFKISFTAENPVVAQRVTSTLTSLFINENLRTREQQSSNTTKFLHEQLEAKKNKLDEQENLLRDFKLQHVGELPEQQQGNLGILTGLQNQLQGTMSGLNRAQQQRVYLQSLVDAYRRQTPASGSAVPLPGGGFAPNRAPGPVELAQSDLARLEASRTALLGKYTPDHPDVQKINREIARAEEMVNRLKASAPQRERDTAPSAAAAPARSAAESSDDVALAQFRSQLEANRVEIENLLKDESHLKTLIAQYESRLNQTPVREQQQGGIVRETEALRQEYAELQKKEQESELATNLEKQQGGQQFRLIDPASFPLVPSSPKRFKLSLFGVAGGLALGLVLAFLLEMRDTSFHSEKELARALKLPFAVAVPVLSTPGEKNRARWNAMGRWVAGSALAVVLLAAELYVYKRG